MTVQTPEPVTRSRGWGAERKTQKSLSVVPREPWAVAAVTGSVALNSDHLFRSGPRWQRRTERALGRRSRTGCVALNSDELDRDPGFDGEGRITPLGIVGHCSDVVSARVCTSHVYEILILTRKGSGAGKVSRLFFPRSRQAYLVARLDRPNHFWHLLTTLSGGSLGSGVDEERSQLRELM